MDGEFATHIEKWVAMVVAASESSGSSATIRNTTQQREV
jgi:hypothetical protein